MSEQKVNEINDKLAMTVAFITLFAVFILTYTLV